jgi:hypothetical protein
MQLAMVAEKMPSDRTADLDQKFLLAELQEKIAPADIGEFNRQAQELLKSQIDENQKVLGGKKEKLRQDSNPIFERAQKYQQVVETIAAVLPDEYGINNSNPQIQIVDTPQQKMISISVDNREIYRAETVEDSKWQEQINLLSDRQIDKLNRLPQNTEEVVQEYAGRRLASHLAQHMGANNQNQFLWKSTFKDGRQAAYLVNLVSRSREGIVIAVKDNGGLQVFKSEIANNGSVDVLENNIPQAHLKNFAEWVNKNQHQQVDQLKKQNESQTQKQNPVLRR